MKQEKILEIAKYIIKNKATVQVTADHFKLSISSIKKYINDDDKLKSIDYDIYEAVKKVQEELIVIGNKVGGKNGKRQPKYSDFEALEIAETIISKSLTLDEAEEYFKIDRSTIYDRIRSIDDEVVQVELDQIFDRNKKR